MIALIFALAWKIVTPFLPYLALFTVALLVWYIWDWMKDRTFYYDEQARHDAATGRNRKERL